MAGRGGGGGAGGDDESTPLFFLLALLICIVAPWTLSAGWALLFPGRQKVQQAFPAATEDGLKVRSCQTQAMVAKREAQIQKLTSRRENYSKGFLFRTAILALLWCWLIYIGVQLNSIMANSSLYVDFDPYALLEVGQSAKKADIKKAFHKMSLKYHPDKNPDPSAAEKFILVKKAFDALTDPVARRNFELYGNPDGPTRIELGVALPSFSKEKQGPVLMLFVLFFILGLPLSVLFCCMGDGEGDKCSNGVLRVTMEDLSKGVTTSSEVRGMQALLLAAAESVASAPRSAEEAKLLAELAEEMRVKAQKGKEQLSKAEVLFFAHTRRLHAKLSPELAQDLDALLQKWRAIILAMADLCVRQGFGSAHAEAMELYRAVVQALEPGAKSELLQVPHFDADRIKDWRKGPRKNAGLAQFLSLSAEDRRASLEGSGLDAQQLLDVEEFARVAPRLSVLEATVDVEGEESICKDDVARLRLRLRRENLAAGEAAGAAHTPLFASAAVPEAWWLTFTVAGPRARTRMVRLTNPAGEFKAELKFRVPSSGKCRCAVALLSEVYSGLDVEQQVTFDAKIAPVDRCCGGGGGRYEESDSGPDDDSS